jgi:hypothetical protein
LPENIPHPDAWKTVARASVKTQRYEAFSSEILWQGRTASPPEKTPLRAKAQVALKMHQNNFAPGTTISQVPTNNQLRSVPKHSFCVYAKNSGENSRNFQKHLMDYWQGKPEK